MDDRPPSGRRGRILFQDRSDVDDDGWTGHAVGARNGSGAQLMKPVVAKLSEKDMLSIAAYLASLAP